MGAALKQALYCVEWNKGKTMSQISLQQPIRCERVRGFQPPWRRVFVYECAHGHEMRLYASGTYARPNMPPGAVMCAQCETKKG